MTAIVKSWNDLKGYGYATLDGRDYFVHYTAIRGEGYKSLKPGASIYEVELAEGPKGAQIVGASWYRPEHQ